LNESLKKAILGKTVKDLISAESVWNVGQKYQWFDVKVEEEERNSHQAIIEDFAEAILFDRKPLVSGEEGRVAIEIVNAIILSSFEGRAISLPMDRRAYDNLLNRLKKEPRGNKASSR